MNTSRMSKLGMAALLSLGAMGGTVAAAVAQTQPAPVAPQSAGAPMQQMAGTPPSLTQAIAIAEAQTGGTAVEADWDDRKGTMVEVETVKADGTKAEVVVNTADGSVKVQALDDNDHENGEDEDES